jgi:hypothetical protein
MGFVNLSRFLATFSVDMVFTAQLLGEVWDKLPPLFLSPSSP